MAALQVLLGRMIGFGYDWLAIGTAMTLTYFACLDSLAGCTLGKLVLGLRVVGLKGQRPSLRQSAHREMFMLNRGDPVCRRAVGCCRLGLALENDSI